MYQALETTNYDSMAQFREHHGVMDKAEYISVLQAGTHRPALMLPRTVTQRWATYPWVASLLGSNMDLQIVLDTYGCVVYVVEKMRPTERQLTECVHWCHCKNH
ncbi:hypothetical protein HPB52_006309 [Rhipicephalus sanguineus]|uniref:Uncharacterized protein n=1 Tax=Rhipicephalus sanguineus TaxID=34632 RepID=A0A9D4PR43_RHISA|nr:hypothetical protein HPB52_006309 [Rhipicephalus sanguineus]